jgi:hypothetical protein
MDSSVAQVVEHLLCKCKAQFKLQFHWGERGVEECSFREALTPTCLFNIRAISFLGSYWEDSGQAQGRT